MKIGLVCPYNILAGGGVQECVFALQVELESRGHTVRILSPRPRGYRNEPPSGVVFVGSAAKVKSFHTTSQISATAEATAVDELLAQEEFDILHFHEPWVPFVSRQILTRSNTCNIATFHAKLPEGRVNRTIEKVITPYTSSILKYFDGLTAVSDAATEYVKTLTDEDITVVPNGIDLNKYRRGKSSSKISNKKTRRLLYIGRLERRKGLVHLLDAFKYLQSECAIDNVQLDIVGSGPDEKRLRRYIMLHDIPNITFHGYVSEEKKITLLQKADVFCSAAIYGESFGIVLLEAMAMGTPTVAADNAGYTSVLKDRGSISIVNPKNTAAFAERLQMFLTDESIRRAWQDWATDYVKQFTYSDIAKQYLDVYKAICKK